VLKRLNEAIIEYLSPWWDGGRGPVFDWVIRCEDVEAHLRKVDGVELVSGTSLLHISEDEVESYTLEDTARRRPAAQVRASCPWSIALPMPTHLVTLVEGAEETDSLPTPTGVGRLAIGSTFIVGSQGVS
jgi:hypothetical protein